MSWLFLLGVFKHDFLGKQFDRIRSDLRCVIVGLRAHSKCANDGNPRRLHPHLVTYDALPARETRKDFQHLRLLQAAAELHHNTKCALCPRPSGKPLPLEPILPVFSSNPAHRTYHRRP